MIDEFDNTNDLDKNTREEVFSQVVKARKRTYFFDVKATRNNEYYLTITESKKRMGKDGKMYYEKHKIFLYKEDFEKFSESLNSVFDYIKANQEIVPRIEHTDEMDLTEVEPDYSSVDFDDLGK
jgi:hypothetical protein